VFFYIDSCHPELVSGSQSSKRYWFRSWNKFSL